MSASFGFQFRFRSGLGHTEFGSTGFDHPRHRDLSFARGLVELGYEEPRWWQWWRWDENRPNEDVMALYRQMKEKP